MGDKEHWNSIYQTKGPTAVSWFAPRLSTSLHFIEQCGVGASSRVIDVGAGASALVDELMIRGVRDVTLLDLSEDVLQSVRQRLEDAGSDITLLSLIAGDLSDSNLSLGPDGFDLWHDRAAFHFLTEETDRLAYKSKLNRVVSGGHAIVATFGPDGPEKCSGLPVVRYSPDELSTELGSSFKLVDSVSEVHHTPFGTTQEFNYCLFRKT